MGIDKASCDYWITGKNNGEMIENPTWKDIEKMILSLDGWNRTLVTFGNYDEGYYMAVGGGKMKHISLMLPMMMKKKSTI